MPQRRILVAKPAAKRSLAQQANSPRAANAAFVSSSTRLNTHVLLGLSMLVLSANARPLDTSGGTGNIGLAALLPGNAAEWAASGKGGIGEQIAESFLKMLHLNGGNAEQAENTLLSNIMRPTSPAKSAAEYPALIPGPPAPAADSADVTWDSAEIQEKTHMFEMLLNQNPALSFALGVADLMHKMRELFVDIAILEGEDRGIFVKEEQIGGISPNSADDVLLEPAHVEGSSALGLQLQPSEQTMPTFPSVSDEDDPPMFELDDIHEADELAIPGQFAPAKVPSAEPQHEAAFTHLNPAVNPYAALALSSVLATLFVVGVVVGRHYYLTSSLGRDGADRNVEDELERGEATIGDASNGGDAEKPVDQPSVTPKSGEETTEELDEKAAMEIEAVNLAVERDASTEQADAREAMALLIDVANAALASAASPSATDLAFENSANTVHTTAGTPKAVVGALELMRSEVSRTPQTRHLNLSNPRTRPSTPSPCTPPCRPQSALGLPAVVIDLDEKTGADSPISAASSFVSAYSHMPGTTLSIGRAAGRHASLGRAAAGRGGSLGRAAGRHGSMARVAVRGRSALEAAFVPQGALSIPQHFTDLDVSLAGSPTPSYVTAIEQPYTPVQPDGQPLRATAGDDMFHTPPTRATSPSNYYPQHPGALMLLDDPDYDGLYGRDAGYGRTGPETSFGTGMQTRPSILPPAQLTQTALELALMLPATEWIFQFIVVFIGWFGFMMRPVPTQRGGARRV